MTTQPMEPAVVVVGARVAGAIAAALLGDAGISVLLLDRALLPSPALSTHFFRGGGLVGVLDRLGLLDSVLSLKPPPLVRQWSYSGGNDKPVEQPPQDPGEIGYCLSVRRESLDDLLVQRALATGNVEVRLNASVTGLIGDKEQVRGLTLETPAGAEEISTRFVIGADGRHSSIAKYVGAPKLEAEDGHRALYYCYVKGWRSPDGSDPSGPEFSHFDDEMAYAFPSDEGFTCLAISVNRETFGWLRRDVQARFGERLSRHRGLAGRGQPFDRVVGGGPEENYVRSAWGNGWALVGDAGQHQDPWSGIGMDLAGLGAEALTEAVIACLQDEMSPEEAGEKYTERRDSIGRDLWRQTVVASRDLSATA